MLMCLDVGNTHLFGGIFMNNDLKLRFRYPTDSPCTSDQLGIFFRMVLRENHLEANDIKAICISSVVPALDYSVIAACIKYLAITPLELKPGLKTGLKLNIKNPLELGADRIANAVGAIELFPNKNIIINDFGTATTLCAVSKHKEYLGGAILPGYKTSMRALEQNAAKLAAVDIIKPKDALGKTTETNIQSGLYYSQLGAIKEITNRIIHTIFQDDEPIILGTGGYAHLFQEENLFTAILPDLVLHGLRLILEKNSSLL